MKRIDLIKRASGGIQLTIDEIFTVHTDTFSYRSFPDGVMLYDKVGSPLMLANYLPALWTINAETNYTTDEEVCSKLDVVIPDSSGGTSFTRFNLTGTDGEFVNGERVGSVKVFTLPADADVSKDAIVFDGLQFTVDFTLSTEGGNPTITFVDAPLTNSYVFYQKI